MSLMQLVISKKSRTYFIGNDLCKCTRCPLPPTFEKEKLSDSKIIVDKEYLSLDYQTSSF